MLHLLYALGALEMAWFECAFHPISHQCPTRPGIAIYVVQVESWGVSTSLLLHSEVAIYRCFD